jgi:hypothetical protein
MWGKMVIVWVGPNNFHTGRNIPQSTTPSIKYGPFGHKIPALTYFLIMMKRRKIKKCCRRLLVCQKFGKTITVKRVKS